MYGTPQENKKKIAKKKKKKGGARAVYLTAQRISSIPLPNNELGKDRSRPRLARRDTGHHAHPSDHLVYSFISMK